MQAAHIPPAPSTVHRPAGKQPRGPPPPRPQATNIIDLPHTDEHAIAPDLVDISVDSGILQVVTNIDQSEKQLQEDLVKQMVELQDFYKDDLSQHASEEIKAAIASELHSLGEKNIYGEVDIDSLTAKQRSHVIKTHWVIRPRPSSTSVDDISETSSPLKTRFIAKGYSQHITRGTTSAPSDIMRNLISIFEYSHRVRHLRTTSTRGLPASTSGSLETTSCIVRIAYIA